MASYSQSVQMFHTLYRFLKLIGHVGQEAALANISSGDKVFTECVVTVMTLPAITNS